MKKIAVIGAGIGGLATAALLAKQGHAVTVFERNSGIGGRARVWKRMGYTFDMGPSWYQVPQAFEHFFATFGKTPADYYELVKPNPQYRVFFGKEDTIDIDADVIKNLKTFERMERGAKKQMCNYLEFAKDQFDILSKHILYGPENFLDYLKPSTLQELKRLDSMTTLENHINKYTTNDRLKQLLLYTILFIGGSPKTSPALFSLLSYSDLVLGTFYPMGGIGSVIKALEQVCKEHNVEILVNQDISHIHVEKNKAVALSTPTKKYKADIVISNADYPFTETFLLDKKHQSYPISYWQGKTASPSAFVVYLGVEKKIKNLAHHNLYLAPNWEEHFKDLFTNKRLPVNPSYYVSCPSKTDSSVAPKGCENIFITVQIPSGIPYDKQVLETYFVKTLRHLEGLVEQEIQPHIKVKRIFSATDFIQDYNAFEGAAIGMAATGFQSVFRPSHQSKKVKNLFYVGQYTSPGPGMPMCLISAEKVARLVQKTI